MRDRKKRPWAHWAEKGGAGPGGPDEKGGAVHGGSGREESAEPGRGGTGPCREGRGHVPLDCEERGEGHDHSARFTSCFYCTGCRQKFYIIYHI